MRLTEQWGQDHGLYLVTQQTRSRTCQGQGLLQALETSNQDRVPILGTSVLRGNRHSRQWMQPTIHSHCRLEVQVVQEKRGLDGAAGTSVVCRTRNQSRIYEPRMKKITDWNTPASNLRTSNLLNKRLNQKRQNPVQKRKENKNG